MSKRRLSWCFFAQIGNIYVKASRGRYIYWMVRRCVAMKLHCTEEKTDVSRFLLDQER
jgi:hypothetical protein